MVLVLTTARFIQQQTDCRVQPLEFGEIFWWLRVGGPAYDENFWRPCGRNSADGENSRKLNYRLVSPENSATLWCLFSERYVFSLPEKKTFVKVLRLIHKVLLAHASTFFPFAEIDEWRERPPPLPWVPLQMQPGADATKNLIFGTGWCPWLDAQHWKRGKDTDKGNWRGDDDELTS